MSVYKSKESTSDGRSYYFRTSYVDIFNNRKIYKSKKYKTKKEAEVEEAYFIINNKDLCQNKNITIEAAFIDLMSIKEKNVKKQTIDKIYDRFKYIEPLKKYKIEDLNINIYKTWIRWFDKQNLCVVTKNKILGLLRQIINHSAKFYNTSDSLVKFIENYKETGLKKEMDFFTYEEYIKFEEVIDDEEWKLFFQMLYYLGLRQGELQALTWNDINFDNKEVSINKTLTSKIKGEEYTITSTKTQKSNRKLLLSDIIYSGLKKQYDDSKKYTNYNKNWFVFGKIRPFKETTIQLHKNKYCDLAGLRRIRIHDFRHSCASLLINKGASITLVSKWLGHSKVSMTLNTYSHMYKSELDNIVDLINKL